MTAQIDATVTVDIEIEVYCSCGHELVICGDEVRQGMYLLDVEPCQHCIDEAKGAEEATP